MVVIDFKAKRKQTVSSLNEEEQKERLQPGSRCGCRDEGADSDRHLGSFQAPFDPTTAPVLPLVVAEAEVKAGGSKGA
jgi:hypothetical protein